MVWRHVPYPDVSCYYMEDSKTTKLLEQIRDLLQKNEARVSVDELTSESERLIKKAEKEGDEAATKIQSSFDRIHDKLFSVNSILIAAFVGFGKFPADAPIFNIWVALLPLLNIFYLIFLEQRQMEVYRHASQRMNWNLSTDVEKYGKMINKQNLRSLLAILTTLGLSIYLAVKIIIY